ncbi:MULTISPECIES: YARHG domain-containing protein [unclassified Oceanispirochaeta]|uniref:YARHG domain-containing protein n=1 Tax=unclassified Oceanispirochaeta TaxID=2635722 RepID=UPI000E090328|nr:MULTISPECIES: YARHG domain-containing protein [unclassified Oceanispirochaeta]MBF9018948.1 YARHG domain-containing protein [Oceanispirochaeta sp. M2]NPD75439.1 YARHG domain-containing protein [Oceanispirochaeta sp. M1]
MLTFPKNIYFESNKSTFIDIEYSSTYGGSGFGIAATYLLGTGRTWNNEIGKLEIYIINKSDLWINNVEIGNSNSAIYQNDNDGHFALLLEDFEPIITDQIFIKLIDYPKFDDPMWGIKSGNFPLSEKKVSENWLRFLTLDQLRKVRNSVFAFHGYGFKSEYLKDYFSSFKWYEKDSDFTESVFNNFEKMNLEKLLEYEESLKIRFDS